MHLGSQESVGYNTRSQKLFATLQTMKTVQESFDEVLRANIKTWLERNFPNYTDNSRLEEELFQFVKNAIKISPK